jgi:hypothetical protein
MLAQVISVTYETDVVTGNRKMGRYGGGNGIWMEDAHPGTAVEFDTEAVALAGREHNNEMYMYGTYQGGAGRPGIRYRTENPGGSHAFGGERNMPRKTGLGLPWNL